MKIRSKIRQRISQALDVLIPENSWDQYIELLDRDGKFTRKNMLAMVMITCQQVENLENLIEDLYYQLDMSGQTQPVAEGFKLRTAPDVIKDLEVQLTPETKTFYVSSEDWRILERTIDLDMAKTKPEYGYGKERNPLSGKDETCLYHKDLPVFKSRK